MARKLGTSKYIVQMISKLYHQQKHSTMEISAKLNLHPSTIRYYLKKDGRPLRERYRAILLARKRMRKGTHECHL